LRALSTVTVLAANMTAQEVDTWVAWCKMDVD